MKKYIVEWYEHRIVKGCRVMVANSKKEVKEHVLNTDYPEYDYTDETQYPKKYNFKIEEIKDEYK